MEKMREHEMNVELKKVIKELRNKTKGDDGAKQYQTFTESSARNQKSSQNINMQQTPGERQNTFFLQNSNLTHNSFYVEKSHFDSAVASKLHEVIHNELSNKGIKTGLKP